MGAKDSAYLEYDYSKLRFKSASGGTLEVFVSFKDNNSAYIYASAESRNLRIKLPSTGQTGCSIYPQDDYFTYYFDGDRFSPDAYEELIGDTWTTLADPNDLQTITEANQTKIYETRINGDLRGIFGQYPEDVITHGDNDGSILSSTGGITENQLSREVLDLIDSPSGGAGMSVVEKTIDSLDATPLVPNTKYLVYPDQTTPANNVLTLPDGVDGDVILIHDPDSKFKLHNVSITSNSTIDGFDDINLDMNHAWVEFIYSGTDSEWKTRDALYGSSTGGTYEFTGLTDTPADYVDSAGKMLAVNATENGLEYVDVDTLVDSLATVSTVIPKIEEVVVGVPIASLEIRKIRTNNIDSAPTIIWEAADNGYGLGLSSLGNGYLCLIGVKAKDEWIYVGDDSVTCRFKILEDPSGMGSFVWTDNPDGTFDYDGSTFGLDLIFDSAERSTDGGKTWEPSVDYDEIASLIPPTTKVDGVTETPMPVESMWTLEEEEKVIGGVATEHLSVELKDILAGLGSGTPVKNKIQTKYLASDVTVKGTFLQFNNLKSGVYYKLDFNCRFSTSDGNSQYIYVRHSGAVIQSIISTSVFGNYSKANSVIFKASSSIVTLDSDVDNTGLKGYGNGQGTMAQLEELNNYEETTDFT